MTDFRIENLTMPSTDFNGVSSLPAIAEKMRISAMQDVFELHEDDELFVNYGMVDYVFPYQAQDNYTRELTDKEQVTVVLENDYLKAKFMPQFGGKLYSLFDKKEQKELLFVNSVVRPCHLSVRSSWMSGGVEWNCGYVGHSPFTCDWLHTAKTYLDDGTPVLRFYQYERIRGIVYQMDFFLPDESRFLYVRTRIVNPQFKVVPMYWWSNIAVPDTPGNRVITPVTNTYTAMRRHPVKIAVPEYNGIDITYPLDNVIAIDYFWNIPDKERKFICQVDQEGYGLVQTSTNRLKGRKLFVWGNSAGGERWKKFLTADDASGSYNEIQAGIAKTQYECLPMPPKTAWEWVEAYGSIQTDASKVHGDWTEAKNEAANRLNEMLTEEALEEILQATKAMAKAPAKEVVFRADGWGALEQERRRIAGEEQMCPYLDFGPVGEEQFPWIELLEKGTLGEHEPLSVPVSYMCQTEWTTLLEQAVKEKDKDNWFTWLQLGLNAFITKDYERAEVILKKSLASKESPWALYVLAILYRDTDNHEEEVKYMLEARDMMPHDVSLAKATLRCLYENKCFDELKRVYETMSHELQKQERCLVYYAFSVLYTGDIESAEKILYADGGLVVPDIREGETITYQLWHAIQEAKGESLDNPPKFVDFRMFANAEWLYGGEIL